MSKENRRADAFWKKDFLDDSPPAVMAQVRSVIAARKIRDEIESIMGSFGLVEDQVSEIVEKGEENEKLHRDWNKGLGI